MPEGVFIPANENVPISRRQVTSLEDYQAAVGGFIEAVYTAEAGQEVVAFINELGKLEGLPENKRATSFLQGRLRHNDYIAGDAIVFGVDFDAGLELDCPLLSLEA